MKHTDKYWIDKIKKLYTSTEGYSFCDWCSPTGRGVYIENNKTGERIREDVSREALYRKMK